MHAWRFHMDYFLHFLSSKTRHGTHSPFVYQLVDEVIYAKWQTDEPKDKVNQLIDRLILRFKPVQVYKLGDEWPEGELDFVIAERNDADIVSRQLQQLEHRLHSGSVVVLEGIYQNAGMKRIWRFAKAKPEVSVAIDLFHVGLIFFHRGQAKESFKIRF